MDTYYSQLDVAQALVDDFMRTTTNEKSSEVKAKAVAQMYSNIQAEEANRLKQQELEIKMREQGVKEAQEAARLAQEAEAAKKMFRLEIAKVCVGGATTLFTMALVAISCAKGDLGFKALKDIRLPFKTL